MKNASIGKIPKGKGNGRGQMGTPSSKLNAALVKYTKRAQSGGPRNASYASSSSKPKR